MNEHVHVNYIHTEQTSVRADSSVNIERIENTIEESSRNKIITEEQFILKVDGAFKKIEELKKLILNLDYRIRNVEKSIELKEIAGKLNKHYEQSRRHK